MKVLLTIGTMTLLLPDEKGLAQVITTLNRGLMVYDRTYQRVDPHIEVREDEMEIRIRNLPPKTKVRVPHEQLALTDKQQ